jgi:ribosomal protein S27AE
MSGYRKKTACDRCGFVAKHASQLMVYHVNGDLTDSELCNLKTVCLNCAVLITRQDLPWRRGDLEPDL